MPDPTTPRTTARRLLGLARPEVPSLALGTACLLVGTSSNLVFPQGLRFMLDEALAGPSTDKIDRATAIMLGVFLVQGIASAARFVLFTRAGERVVAHLRERLFESLMRQDIAFFDTQKTGDLTNRLASDTAVLQNTVSVNISMALRALATVVGGVVLLFYTSPRLTALMLLVVPPVAILAMRYGRRVRKVSRDAQDALAESTHVAEESLSGVRTVRAFAAEGREVVRFAEAVRRSLSLAYLRIRLGGLFFGVASFAAYGAGALMFWYGGRLVLRGEMSVGALTSFLVYTMLVAISLASMADLWADFNRAAGASERVFELLDRRPALVDGARTPEGIVGRVEWRDVSFAYPTRPDAEVLRGFSLVIAPGEVVALVGPSGAGKSTTLALIERLYDPSRGEVLLDGVPLTDLEGAWLRRQVGVVAQEPLLFSCSIGENIRYGKPAATAEEVKRAAKLANAHAFIERFPEGYDTLVGERGVQLSGGQKQRVAIARAVLKDPRVLVLDEATSALDAESEALVRDALERLMKGRTTLVIAHRLSSVKNADRVAVLDGGRIVELGTHAALLEEGGLYKRLVEKQFTASA